MDIKPEGKSVLCKASSYSLLCSLTRLLMIARPKPDASFFAFAVLLFGFGRGRDRSGAPGYMVWNRLVQLAFVRDA